MCWAWVYAQITTSAQIAHDGMHCSGSANDGVHRTRLNTLSAANTVIFIDNRNHTRRCRHLRFAIQRLWFDVEQLGNFQHYSFATRRAAVDFFTVTTDSLRVRATARITALATLALR